MTKMNFEQQAALAQKEMESWSNEKKGSVQLQGKTRVQNSVPAKAKEVVQRTPPKRKP